MSKSAIKNDLKSFIETNSVFVCGQDITKIRINEIIDSIMADDQLIIDIVESVLLENKLTMLLENNKLDREKFKDWVNQRLEIRSPLDSIMNV